MPWGLLVLLTLNVLLNVLTLGKASAICPSAAPTPPLTAALPIMMANGTGAVVETLTQAPSSAALALPGKHLQQLHTLSRSLFECTRQGGK